MNLNTATGWCNSTCLREVDEDPDNSNQAAKCFINKVNEKRNRSAFKSFVNYLKSSFIFDFYNFQKIELFLRGVVVRLT